jgi:hypothetical protein
MCRTTSRTLASLANLLLAGFALRGLRSRHLWHRVCAACAPRGCAAGC